MWPVSIAHIRGYLHNSHMTKTTCDVYLAPDQPLSHDHYANQLIDMCILYKVDILYLETFFFYMIPVVLFMSQPNNISGTALIN